MRALFCDKGHEMLVRDTIGGKEARCSENGCEIPFTHISLLLSQGDAKWVSSSPAPAVAGKGGEA